MRVWFGEPSAGWMRVWIEYGEDVFAREWRWEFPSAEVDRLGKRLDEARRPIGRSS